jgi:hypothetical protein
MHDAQCITLRINLCISWNNPFHIRIKFMYNFTFIPDLSRCEINGTIEPPHGSNNADP